MDYDVRIMEEPGRHLAVTRFRAEPEQIAARIGPAFGTVMAYLDRHGLRPSGPAVGYYDIAGERFDVAAGFVVPAAIEAEVDVEPLTLPAGEVLSTLHVGSYAELPKAYDALQTEATRLGRELDRSVMWEEYLTGPDTPERLQCTLVTWPVQHATA